MAREIFRDSRVAYGLAALAIIAAVAASLLLIRFQADAQAVDWPPLTMIYEVAGVPVSAAADAVSNPVEVHRLDFQSKDEWVDEVIKSPPIKTRVGVFSNVGSYQRVSNGEFTVYSSVTGDSTTETIEAGVRMIPGNGLLPFPIEVIENSLGIQLSRAPTASRVCFQNQCEVSAEGLRFVDGGREVIYADDSRGIPLKIGVFVIKELLVHGERQAVQR